MIIEEITEENYLERERLQTEFIGKLERLGRVVDEKKISELMFDPSLWAFMYLRDKQNRPLILRYFQDRLINDKNRFVFCVAANQIGKSWAICIKALHHALHVNNASVIIVSRSEEQAIKLLDEIKWFMRRSTYNFETIKYEVDNRTELHIKGTKGGVSLIKVLPPTESVLGYPATLLLLDEVSFWEKGVKLYQQVLEPRTNEMKSWV